MKKYNEPEFEVIKTASQDVITASTDVIPGASSGWESPEVPLGLI